MADKYVLRVTAGPSYDLSSHTEVPVNSTEPVKLSTPHIDVDLNVRIQNYSGLPRDSPSTSPYFSAEPHARNADQYSIAFRFTPKKPAQNGSAKTADTGATDPPAEADDDNDDDDDSEEDSEEDSEDDLEGISGADLQFGNDFDHPIRDRLPPGFGTAMNIVRWWIDPGLEGDPYADEPYLYGPALSSFNSIHVGPGTFDEDKGGLWLEEGGDDEGLEARRAVGAPDDAKGRMKWALRNESKEAWVWEYGRTYGVDFFNPYIDFSEFALRLPGFHLPIMKYWDGQGLRYVLRNRATKDVYLVVLFTLYLKEDVNEDGSIKPEALKAYSRTAAPLGGTEPTEDEEEDEEEEFDGEKAIEEARRKLSTVDVGDKEETSADDVD
ncbi:DUF1769-domain-containing protein [Pleurostoma richardsiae]|uniref:DUF1769-domain-containing protein n=1 Tax=Pleurostoma richardsiae TaxID=41990 RepID=A0AA38VT21_9PEZI|nr:DUF1769-domain-containing protein [Pleurostoma richardsiae]